MLSIIYRTQRKCSYVYGTKRRKSPADGATQAGVVNEKQELRNDFPVAFFLDPVLSNCRTPQSSLQNGLAIPQKIGEILGDGGARKAIATEYFKTADRWMPIVSRIRLYGALINSPQDTDPTIVSILLAMKLLLSAPGEPNVCSELYAITKEWQLRLEMTGHLTVYTIQSEILVALYEIGHAIFPGAFTTIATTARHAIVLGIDGTLPMQGEAWVEQEERNRTWWAVLILDRYVSKLCLWFRES